MWISLPLVTLRGHFPSSRQAELIRHLQEAGLVLSAEEATGLTPEPIDSCCFLKDLQGFTGNLKMRAHKVSAKLWKLPLFILLQATLWINLSHAEMSKVTKGPGCSNNLFCCGFCCSPCRRRSKEKCQHGVRTWKLGFREWLQPNGFGPPFRKLTETKCVIYCNV